MLIIDVCVFLEVKMKKILIKNVRTLNREHSCDILVEDGKIADISDSLPVSGADEEYGFNGGLLTPALINIHTHLDKSNLSKYVINETGSIGEARKKLFDYKKNMTVEDIKERARQIILESVDNGILFLRTHADVDPVIGTKGIIALLELREEFKDLIKIEIVAFPQEGISESPGTYALLESAMNLGADLIGGHLSIARDFNEHSMRVFELADKFGCDIDVHVDYDINRDYSTYRMCADGKEYPKELGIVDLCQCKRAVNFSGMVTASHLCGLSSAYPEDAEKIIGLLHKEDINVVALAPNNLYCNGRDDKYNIRRGVTLVKPLLYKGINVSYGPDNIRDPFNPLGSPDMIINGLITAYGCHFSNKADYDELLNMCTYRAAKIMKLDNYGLKIGCDADFTVFKSDSSEKIFAGAEKPAALFRKGSLIFNHV